MLVQDSIDTNMGEPIMTTNDSIQSLMKERKHNNESIQYFWVNGKQNLSRDLAQLVRILINVNKTHIKRSTHIILIPLLFITSVGCKICRQRTYWEQLSDIDRGL